MVVGLLLVDGKSVKWVCGFKAMVQEVTKPNSLCLSCILFHIYTPFRPQGKEQRIEQTTSNWFWMFRITDWICIIKDLI